MTNQTNEAIERYKLEIINNDGDQYIRCEPAPNGSWVMFKDVEAQAARIAELEAAVRTLKAERDQLIGALQIAIERSGDLEPRPSWVDGACGLLNQGFLKVDRAALEGKWDGST